MFSYIHYDISYIQYDIPIFQITFVLNKFGKGVIRMGLIYNNNDVEQI